VGKLKVGAFMKTYIPFSLAVVLSVLSTSAAEQKPARWWMDEPIRFVQTNLRERDSAVDPKRLVQQVAEYRANVFLCNMGGIVAQYPTDVEFHYRSRFLPPGRDLFGEVLKEAHARKIRVVGRFDLSKTEKAVYDARPQWFFVRTNGQPHVFNGLYSACINGAYYREHGIGILTEALQRYDVDGLFFNMFGNPSTDYGGNPMGPCQCDQCKTRFEKRFGRKLPATLNDPDYRGFMRDSSSEVAGMFADLIHRLRPGAGFFTYVDEHTDGIMSESNTAVGRALPLWPYSASDNVNRALNSEPGKMSFNLCMSFVDYNWRFVTVPQAEIRLRLHQNLAHGAPPALVVLGTMDQEDRQSLIAGKSIFEWHEKHPDLYVGQRSAARVLLLGGGQQAAYRGFFRLLSEQHIPFAVSSNLKWLDDPGRKFDLVIAPGGGAAPELDRYVKGGGALLIAGATPLPAPLEIGKVVARRDRVQAAWRVHDHALLPSLKDTNLLMLDGEYVELAALEKPLLTLIPPAMGSPPEKVWADKVETTIPGLVIAARGAGRIAYVPWDVGGLYYRHSSQGHAGLMADVIDHLLVPRGGRQLRTNAHPLLEITVMRQPSRNRTLVHFVNVSGHSSTAYFAPVEMRDVRVELAGRFPTAMAVALNQKLQVTAGNDGMTAFTLPRVGEYEVVVLE
jgi:hypothetical protein